METPRSGLAGAATRTPSACSRSTTSFPPPLCLGISPVEDGREGLRLVHHVGGEHLRGDGPDVPRVVDCARRDHERVAGAKREGRPVVELHRNVAPHDVPDFGTRMAVPAGGYALGGFD